MKRLAGIMAMAAVFAILTGCASDNHQEVHLNIGDNTSSTSATTTAAPITTNAAVVTNQEPTITKAHKIENVSTAATLLYQSRNLEGTLLLTESGFYFTPKEGQELKFPLNSILLLVVDYEENASYETLVMFTPADEFEFKVEIGYTEKISEYLLVSEAASSY